MTLKFQFHSPCSHGHMLSAPVRALGYSAWRGSLGPQPAPTVKLRASQVLRAPFLPHTVKEGAVPAPPSSKDSWELKISIRIERECQRECSQRGLLLIIVPYFVAFLMPLNLSSKRMG